MIHPHQHKSCTIMHRLVKKECCLSCVHKEVAVFRGYPTCICRATADHPNPKSLNEFGSETFGEEVEIYGFNPNCQNYSEAAIHEYLDYLPSDFAAPLVEHFDPCTHFSETPEYKEIDNAPTH